MDGAAQKRPKERAPRSRRHLPALLGKIGARLTRRAHAPGARRSAARPFGGMEVHRTSMNTPPYPRAQTRGSLLPIFPAMLGDGYGDLKTPSARSRQRGSSAWGFLKPRMAHPSPARLWACAPKGSRTGMCATGPRDRKSRWASAGTQSRGGEEKCAIRAAFSFVHFFWPNKRNGPRVQGRRHPQLAFQTVRAAHTIM